MIKDYLTEIKDKKPLVHHITNNVTVNDCANITLSWGGLPVMAYAQDEVEEMVRAASALVLNIGTLSHEQVEAMLMAGSKANEMGVPIIFDPVGVGATTLRTETAFKILRELNLAVIKGNQGEITTLAGAKGEMKGVESVGKYYEIAATAKMLAEKQGAVVVVSGREDIITDGKEIYLARNGHPLMGQIVGTGCMLASTLGVFCGVTDNNLKSSMAAVTAYGIAGEKAGEMAERPASYKIAFMDAISEINGKDLITYQQITKAEEGTG